MLPQWYLELPQVPHLEGAVVTPTQQERLAPAPVDDIDVPVVRAGRGQHAGLAGRCADVPDADGGIG